MIGAVLVNYRESLAMNRYVEITANYSECHFHFFEADKITSHDIAPLSSELQKCTVVIVGVAYYASPREDILGNDNRNRNRCIIEMTKSLK